MHEGRALGTSVLRGYSEEECSPPCKGLDAVSDFHIVIAVDSLRDAIVKCQMFTIAKSCGQGSLLCWSEEITRAFMWSATRFEGIRSLFSRFGIEVPTQD